VIIIIGAGITGLTAAYELTQRHVPFVLLEAGGRPGGLIRTEHIDGFTIDLGADSMLVQKPAALKLCEELGLSARLMSTRRPRTAFIVRDGRLHALPSPSVLGIPTTLPGLAKYSLLDWRTRARVAVEPLIPARSYADESVASFFRRRFGPATVDLIAEPLLGGIHAGDVEKLSMPSLFPRFTSAERQRGGVLRTVAPPPSGDGLFRALKGGMAELVDSLVHRLPAGSLLLETPAAGMRRQRSGWLVSAGGEGFEAASVIVAAPAYVAADDLNDVRQPGALDVLFELLCAHRIVFDGHESAAGRAQSHPDPDGAGAARAADLERPLRAARCDHQPHEAAVLFRDRELALVLGFDLGEQFGRDLIGVGDGAGGGFVLRVRAGRTSHERDQQEHGESIQRDILPKVMVPS